jgi:excisionase family DNA binding protein
MTKPATQLPEIRYIDDRAAAEYLNVSTSTLAKWRMRGVGPRFHRFGSLVRYSVADLGAYAEQSRSA